MLLRNKSNKYFKFFYQLSALNIKNYHTPVLLQTAVDLLDVQKNCWYIDATIGFGGHTLEVLKRGGKVIGIDQDSQLLAIAKDRLKQQFPEKNFVLIHANFVDLEKISAPLGHQSKGIIFDLGVSSFQLSEPGRGFSFQRSETLDMRMNRLAQVATALQLVNGLYKLELERLLINYSQEPLAAKIAQAIVSTRQKKPIKTTLELAELVKNCYQKNYRRPSLMHPATKTFQALRIAVNDELNNLDQGLDQAIKILSPNSRIVVISFHSLEDKIIKQKFISWSKSGLGKIITQKPIVPEEQELSQNPSSRSAKLRAFLKL